MSRLRSGLKAQMPYRDGTTQVAFEPVDFMARLAALVPKPRVNLTRFHGVLAPNHRWRGLVISAKRGKGVKRMSNGDVRSPAEWHVAMNWAQRLIFKRRNKTFPPSRCSHLLQGHHLSHCLFSLERNPVQQHSICKEATEKVWLGSLHSTVQQ